MKKILLSIAAVATMAFTAEAQITITPKAGLTLSSIARSKDYKDELKSEGGKNVLSPGFAFGAAFELGLSDNVSIQPELLYIQKGTKEKYESQGESGTIQFKMNYLELPVLLKFASGATDEFHFFGYVGPYFGYALKGKNTFKSGGTTFTTKIKFGEGDDSLEEVYVNKDEANRLDVGAYLGGGVKIPLGPGAVSLEARYGYGFVNYNKDDSGQLSKDQLKSQNRTIGIFAGYAIPLGK